MTRAALMLMVAVWCAAGRPSAVHAAPAASSIDHYQVGKWLFERKRYAEAIDEFRLALSIAPRPEVLYSIAQAQRMLGDCDSAIDSYRAFLAGRPEAPLDEYARANIERCEQTLREKQPTPRAWYADTVGDALVGGGLVVGVVGALVWRSGHRAATAVGSAPDYQSFLQRQASASSALTQQRLGVAAMVAGSAAIIAGAIHIVHRARSQPGDAAVAIAVTDGGAVVAAAGRF